MLDLCLHRISIAVLFIGAMVRAAKSDQMHVQAVQLTDHALFCVGFERPAIGEHPVYPSLRHIGPF